MNETERAAIEARLAEYELHALNFETGAYVYSEMVDFEAMQKEVHYQNVLPGHIEFLNSAPSDLRTALDALDGAMARNERLEGTLRQLRTNLTEDMAVAHRNEEYAYFSIFLRAYLETIDRALAGEGIKEEE